MAKTTKKQLEKQITEMQSKIEDMEKEKSSLLKELNEAKAKVQFYENLPQAACNSIGGGIDFILKAAFPQGQQK